MVALCKTLVDKYAESFENNLRVIEKMYKDNNNKIMPRKDLRWWAVQYFRQELQRFLFELDKLKKV